MNKRGSILMIALWIVAILAILAVGLGHRASINLKLARYQRDRLSATLSARSLLATAISEINTGSAEYSGLDEEWADKKKMDVVDEESKINLNTTDKALLKQLFQIPFSTADADRLADLTTEWTITSAEVKTGEQIIKNAPLSAPEELILIFEYYLNDKDKAQAAYGKLKGLITVYGQEKEKINLNTINEAALTIFTEGLALEPELPYVSTLVGEIIKLRNTLGHFKNSGDVVIPNAEQYKELLNKLLVKAVFVSNNFRIQANGKVGNVSKNISAVYDRSKKSIVYWHEN